MGGNTREDKWMTSHQIIFKHWNSEKHQIWRTIPLTLYSNPNKRHRIFVKSIKFEENGWKTLI